MNSETTIPLSWRMLLPENPWTLWHKELEARLTLIQSITKSGALSILSESDLDEFHARVIQYFVHLVQDPPRFSWLLNTKTYRDTNSPVNPNFIELVWSFWLKKSDTPRHHERYIQWLKNNLLIERDSLKSDDLIEQEANKEIQSAINLIKKIESQLWDDWMHIIAGSNSRSPAFDVIHSEDITVNKLLHLCYLYLHEYHKAKKALSNIKDKESWEYKRQRRIMLDRNKSMFEVARIFAFTETQLRVKQVHGKWTQKADKMFLVNKMIELIEWAKEMSEDDIFRNDNPFFQITNTENIYWSRSGSGYNLWDEEIGNELKLEWCIIAWPTSPAWKNKSVKVRHIDFRWEKSIESATLKTLRKNLESPHEILDDRGFRFVVDTEEDAYYLCSILAYWLGAGPQSWKTEPRFESNQNSWSNFRCLKGNLAVWHKRGHSKDLKKKVLELIPDDSRVNYLMPDQGYQLETEIQIFVWIDSYISAHHDPKSPAYHKNYKSEQVLELGWKMYPPSIFPQSYKSIIRELWEKKWMKYIRGLWTINFFPSIPGTASQPQALDR